jgi:hypothetical protein
MVKTTKHNTSSISYDGWTTLISPPRVMINSNTHYELSDNVVLVKGQYVIGANGVKQLMVSVDPATIERKLAIRELNAQLEGRILKSHTQAVTF